MSDRDDEIRERRRRGASYRPDYGKEPTEEELERCIAEQMPTMPGREPEPDDPDNDPPEQRLYEPPARRFVVTRQRRVQRKRG